MALNGRLATRSIPPPVVNVRPIPSIADRGFTMPLWKIAVIALKPFTAWWVRSTVTFCALSCVLLSSWVSGLWGADPQGGHYQAYPLRHKQVAEIEEQLQDLLQNVQPPPRIIPDGPKNQILV